ncbi:hypothetical protein [Bacillus horti]|uniref:Uncharacterized protein n=1 Tax=Caldalkalibacillus horti TaxID=77523 RepID=A0ABT9VT97_9BACI|nr:hypothetical protein [Bacillus horti]MDQ0164105.1 hypothetical protein [Bacillus horti]
MKKLLAGIFTLALVLSLGTGALAQDNSIACIPHGNDCIFPPVRP